MTDFEKLIEGIPTALRDEENKRTQAEKAAKIITDLMIRSEGRFFEPIRDDLLRVGAKHVVRREVGVTKVAVATLFCAAAMLKTASEACRSGTHVNPQPLDLDLPTDDDAARELFVALAIGVSLVQFGDGRAR